MIVIGDPHLGKGVASLAKSSVGAGLNSRIADQLNILEWSLQQAIDFIVSDIIVTGDIFEENKPHPTIISVFIQWLKKCTDNNVNVHLIRGNHDEIRSGQHLMSPLDIISAAEMLGIFCYNQISTLHMDGVSFTLVPFRDRRSFNVDSNSEALKLLQEKLPYELANIDRNNAKVMIGHLAIEKSIPIGDEIRDLTNELFCPLSMFNGYDFTWMGHIHKPQVMSKSPYVAHIGSMDLSDFSETNHTKTLVLFDVNKGYKHLEVPSRPLNQISISVPENIINTTDYIKEELLKLNNDFKKSIVKLNITLNNADIPNIDRSNIEKHLYDMGTYHISRINEERKVSPIKKNNISNHIDNTVNEFAAIKMFAEENIDADIRDQFVSIADEIVKDCVAE